MLRGSIASSNRLLKGAAPRRPLAQWLVVARARKSGFGQRTFADTKKPEGGSISGSDPTGAAATTIPTPDAASSAPGSLKTPASSSTPADITPQNAPPTSPPAAPKVEAAPPASSPPPPPPPPPPPKKSHRFRNFLVLLFLTGAAYGAGVYYSLVDDNFHDFFTEYIPFGEECVLYLQERDFHRRFPNAIREQNKRAGVTREPGNQVTIPSRSGLSWSVSEESNPEHELQPKGRHMNATVGDTPKSGEGTVVVSGSKTADVPASGVKTTVEKVEEKDEPKLIEKDTSNSKSPKDELPTAELPATLIEPLKLDQAAEPLVQDIVNIVNDIIATVAADDASQKYSASINKAKDELAKVGQRIINLKDSEQAAAQEKIKERETLFEEAHMELLRRIEEVQMEDAARFREEFEAEREKIAQQFAEKLKTESTRSSEVAEQRLRNELLEQAIEMKRQFVADVQSLVENERDGRLSKLAELQNQVAGLEKMASDWNGVIDSNLQTQQLQVAVDAVRSTLARSDIPRPFVRELAALKEIASDDPVVNAAIGSINPSAYQRGIPTSAQLVDRFRSVATEVRKASLLPEHAGIASAAASLVLSKLLFKKTGLAQGDDVESILTRTETFLEEGDLDGAAREMNGLDGWAKTLSKDWLADVRKVLEVKQALEVIETEARLQCLMVE